METETDSQSQSQSEVANERQTNGNHVYTGDGSLNRYGKPAIKWKTGKWKCAMLILVNQGLATLAFAAVEINATLFSKSVLRQSNADSAKSFNVWMGTVYLFSLMGAFLSDSYLGRYRTILIFQLIFILGLVALALVTQFSLVNSPGCGTIENLCNEHTKDEIALFYVAIYLLGLGNGASEPAIATFGADQFDEEDPKESKSKVSFFSYFYVSLNLGSLIAETVIVYITNMGNWVWGFWICTACAIVAFLFILSGVLRYRRFKPSGNPISRFAQVIVASIKKTILKVPLNGRLYETHEGESEKNVTRKILHSDGFKCLDRAAIMTQEEMMRIRDKGETPNPWRLCSITQVEEVKCVLRLMPIWLCTIVSSAVYTQMFSLFTEQGAAMDTKFHTFHIPPVSMTVFDIVSTTIFIILYDKVIAPLYTKLAKKQPEPPNALKRIGIGLATSTMVMIVAGLTEWQRLKYASHDNKETSSLSIFWQIPQYVSVGISEAFLYVAQMEFFASEMPDRLKSLGIGLSMSSSALGSYVCSLFLTVVMEITTKYGKPGWVPANLNHGHLDLFYFLSAALSAANLGLYIFCAKRYQSISLEKRDGEREMDCVP